MAPRRRWSFFMTALEHPPILWFDDLLPIVTLVLGYYFGQSSNKGG